MRPLSSGFTPLLKKNHTEMRESGLLLSCRCLWQKQAHLSCSVRLYFHDFHLRELDHQPGLFPLSPSAALLDDQTTAGARTRLWAAESDTRPRVRRGPRQVHQRRPGEQQNSLETPAVNSGKVPRAA